MSFWETVRGARLADTLTRELPRLTAKKKQVMLTVEDNNLTPIYDYMEKGYLIDEVVSIRKNNLLFVLSKPV